MILHIAGALLLVSSAGTALMALDAAKEPARHALGTAVLALMLSVGCFIVGAFVVSF